MSDLERALADIGAIRAQMARGAAFHGLGPTAFAATGVLAALAAFGQALWTQTPTAAAPFLTLWMTVAAISGVVIVGEMIGRSRRLHSDLADELIAAAIWQFLPAAVAGGLITLVLARFAPQSLWMVPGFWQICYGLGVFASCRFLPRPIALAGAWYLLTGLFCIRLANGRALSPWAMGIPYAVGQLLVAGILLYCTREDRDEC